MRIKAINKVLIMSAVLAAALVSCKDKMDFQQDYPFEVKIMPVKKKIQPGETTEIRCRLEREGFYQGAEYFIRYFQADGKGQLALEGRELSPNDLFRIHSDDFRLYYTSLSTEMQNIDVVVEDNFGQIRNFRLSFQNERSDTGQESGDGNGNGNNDNGDGNDTGDGKPDKWKEFMRFERKRELHSSDLNSGLITDKPAVNPADKESETSVAGKFKERSSTGIFNRNTGSF